MRKVKSLFFTLLALLYVTAANALIVNDKFTIRALRIRLPRWNLAGTMVFKESTMYSFVLPRRVEL